MGILPWPRYNKRRKIHYDKHNPASNASNDKRVSHTRNKGKNFNRTELARRAKQLQEQQLEQTEEPPRKKQKVHN
jgi:hypothetical protein